MSDRPDPRAEYTRRLAKRDEEIAAGEKRHQVVANLRLAVIAATGVVIWFVWTGRATAPWFGLPLAAFVVLVIWHDRILNGIERSKRARRIYERGIARLDGTWVGHGPDGSRFSALTTFAPDLDLFGNGSLFQLLSTARTEIGEEVLADWLTTGAPTDEVRVRQAAVDELRSMVDFREALAVTAAEGRIGRTGALARWSAFAPTGAFGSGETSSAFRATSPAAAVAFTLLSLLSVALIVASLTTNLPVRVVFVSFLAQIAISTMWMQRAGAELGGIDDAGPDLALLKSLVERLETQAFLSSRLISLRDALPAEGRLASQQLAALQRLITAFDSCSNPMVMPFAKFLQIPAHLLMAVGRWRSKHGHAVAGWLRAVGEAEAFSALATFAFENPESPFPIIESAGPVFHADALAHPLLSRAVAVPNDVRLGGLAQADAAPHVLMVSGSNMSGKSTLLRAVGVNVVLALAGAPVRASTLRLSPVSLGVSLRIDDSLQGGQSKFYAEILRLRSIVDLAKGPVPLLFLLDEILAGTNSFDRRIGAEAIIKSLAALGAIGLVTTHDLALTALVPALGVAAANVHFEDRIEDGKMVFDYRMRPGVVERSNALALMRAIGLDV